MAPTKPLTFNLSRKIGCVLAALGHNFSVNICRICLGWEKVAVARYWYCSRWNFILFVINLYINVLKWQSSCCLSSTAFETQYEDKRSTSVEDNKELCLSIVSATRECDDRSKELCHFNEMYNRHMTLLNCIKSIRAWENGHRACYLF